MKFKFIRTTIAREPFKNTHPHNITYFVAIVSVSVLLPAVPGLLGLVGWYEWHLDGMDHPIPTIETLSPYYTIQLHLRKEGVGSEYDIITSQIHDITITNLQIIQIAPGHDITGILSPSHSSLGLDHPYQMV